MAVENETADRDAFDRDIRRQNLLGYWMIPTRSDGFREPKPSYGPFLWDWATLHRSLHEAVRHVPKEEAHRRFIGFQHPDLKMGTVPNVILGGQLITAGEIAPPHRHTHAVVYHVPQGSGVSQVGETRFEWCAGDTFIVPLWTWHAHENKTGEPAVLFSINDRPVMASLGFDREEAAH